MGTVIRNVRRKWLEVIVTVLSLYNHDVHHPHHEAHHPVAVVRRIEVTR